MPIAPREIQAARIEKEKAIAAAEAAYSTALASGRAAYNNAVRPAHELYIETVRNSNTRWLRALEDYPMTGGVWDDDYIHSDEVLVGRNADELEKIYKTRRQACAETMRIYNARNAATVQHELECQAAFEKYRNDPAVVTADALLKQSEAEAKSMLRTASDGAENKLLEVQKQHPVQSWR